MNVLVLGGSYFVGLAILDALVAAGATVSMLNRGTKAVSVPGVRHLACDRNDVNALRQYLSENYDIVIDVSGYVPTEISNVIDSLSTLPSKYIFISSAAVYDRELSPPPFVEDGPVGGDKIWGTYGVDKYACEQLLQRALASRLFVIRPPYMYGPNNYVEREQFVWARLLAEKPIFVPSDGNTKVQFCHSDVLAQFVTQIASGDHVSAGTYNIGEGRYYSFLQWIDILAKTAGRKADIRFARTRDVKARDYFPFRDNDLTLDVTRWRSIDASAEVTLDSGLAQTLEWFLQKDLIRYEPTSVERAWLSGST